MHLALRSARPLRSACRVAAPLVLLVACATSPTGRNQLMLVSDEQMAELGAAAFLQMQQEQPVSRDDATTAYVRCVADAITSVIDSEGEPQSWEVVVFEDPTANAFALPGGKIGVHTGLLDVAETPAQLAAVIGHEVAHVIADHSGERVSQSQAANLLLSGVAVSGVVDPATTTGRLALGALGLGVNYGVLMPYSRTQESEADTLGIDYMARAGFDPQASVELWQNMEAAGGGQPPEFLSTHPSHGTRIENLHENMPAAMELYREARAAGRNPTCRR